MNVFDAPPKVKSAELKEVITRRGWDNYGLDDLSFQLELYRKEWKTKLSILNPHVLRTIAMARIIQSQAMSRLSIESQNDLVTRFCKFIDE